MLQFNEPITFGPAGSARDLNPTGISFEDSGAYSWTIAPVADLEVQLPLARETIKLEVNAMPFTPENTIVSQQVFIYLNGLFQGFCSMERREKKSIALTRSALTTRPSRLTFVIPTAASPKSIGIGPDIRELGLALNTLTFVT